MNMVGLQCNGCGSTNVDFDAKNRVLTCRTCGKVEYYSRATLNANGKVVYGKRNAVNFFMSGQFDTARNYAHDVLNLSVDHAPSLFIIAYCDAFRAHKTTAMQDFFNQILDVPLEYEELQDLRELLCAAAVNLGDFEEPVIRLMALNMQAEEDKQDLCEFIDRVCPYWIARRPSASFLDQTLLSHYMDLAEHCGIPKTCFALLKGIETNPDSPYKSNSFYQEVKTRYFYQHYVNDVGKVIGKISNAGIQQKFLQAYRQICAKFERDAGWKP